MQVKASQMAFSKYQCQPDAGRGQSPLGAKPGEGQSPSHEWPGGDDGEVKEAGVVTEGSQANLSSA